MATGKKIHDLVLSLSPNEKRHFKLKCSVQSGQRNYISLFEALDKMQDYNRNDLLDLLGHARFTKDLHVTENYLYQRILESLRTFHEEKSIETQLYTQLINAALLENKGFYELSNKMLLKAKKNAEKIHHHLLLIDILKRQARNLAAMQTKEIQEQTDEVCHDLRSKAVLLKEEVDFFCLNQTSFVRYRKWKLSKDNIQKQFVENTLQNKLIKDDPAEKSFYSKYLHHNTKNNCYSLLGKYKEASLELENVINLWDKNPIIKKEKKCLYIIQLSNLINQKNKIKDYHNVEKLIARLENVKAISFNEKAELFQNVYFHKITYYLNRLEFEKAYPLIPKIEQGLELYKNKINRARELAFYCNISSIFFLSNAYDNAIYWLQKIQAIKRTNEPRKDIQRFSRILQLAIYYNLGDYEILEYMFRSIYRKRALMQSLHEFERMVLTYFKDLLKTIPNSQEEQLLFVTLKDSLLSLSTKEKRVLGFEEFMFWTDSHIKQLQ